MQEDFLNSNGLVDGKIPAKKECPFLEKCQTRTSSCPSKDKPHDVPFSCGFARAFSIVRRDLKEMGFKV